MTARPERLTLYFHSALEQVGPFDLGWPGNNAPRLLKGPCQPLLKNHSCERT